MLLIKFKEIQKINSSIKANKKQVINRRVYLKGSKQTHKDRHDILQGRENYSALKIRRVKIGLNTKL